MKKTHPYCNHPQLERVSPTWVHESEECGEENLWRPQGSDGYLGDRLEIQVCQAGERIANLWGALLPGQGKPWLFVLLMCLWGEPEFFQRGQIFGFGLINVIKSLSYPLSRLSRWIVGSPIKRLHSAEPQYKTCSTDIAVTTNHPNSVGITCHTFRQLHYEFTYWIS